MKLRWAKRQDVPFLVSNQEEKEFLNRLRNNTRCIVCEFENKIVGYMVYNVNVNSYHIINLVIDKEYQRKSIGKSFVQYLIQKNKAYITSFVSENNLIAQFFFKKMGFLVKETIPDFFGERNDAYNFVL